MKWLKIIGINLIPLLMILFNIDEFFQINNPKNDYPFGSEFFSSLSIYSSKMTYIFYLCVFTLSLISLIVSNLTHKKKMYIVFLIFSIVLFLYPIFTNE